MSVFQKYAEPNSLVSRVTVTLDFLKDAENNPACEQCKKAFAFVVNGNRWEGGKERCRPGQ